jgi:type VI secretion system secreted protein Hcp
MTTTTFIKFDGIEGESTTVDHKGEIDLLSWSWGLSATTVTSGGGGGASVGKVSPRDFQFVHRYDKASPMLARNAALGKHIATAVVSSRKAGAGQKDFLKITMKDVLITSIATGDDGAGATEHVSIVYGEIEFGYRPQTPAGGLGAPVTFDWNTKTGTVT